MKKSFKIIMLLSILVSNNIYSVKRGLTIQTKESLMGQTHQEENSASSDSDSEYIKVRESNYELEEQEPSNQSNLLTSDSLAEEYHDQTTITQNEFNKFGNKVKCKWIGLSGLCLVAGLVILLNKLSSY